MAQVRGAPRCVLDRGGGAIHLGTGNEPGIAARYGIRACAIGRRDHVTLCSVVPCRVAGPACNGDQRFRLVRAWEINVGLIPVERPN